MIDPANVNTEEADEQTKPDPATRTAMLYLKIREKFMK